MLNFRHRAPQYSPSCRSSSQRKLTFGCEPGFGLIQLCECFEGLSSTAIISRREWLRTVKVNIELMFESKVITTKYLTLYTKSEHTALIVTQKDLNSKQPSQCRIQYCVAPVQIPGTLRVHYTTSPYLQALRVPIIRVLASVWRDADASASPSDTSTLPPVSHSPCCRWGR